MDIQVPEHMDQPERLAALLLLNDALDKNNRWVEFERQLIYENRFSSSHPIVEEVRRHRDSAARHLAAGSTFYRARTYDRSTSATFLQYCFGEGGVDREQVESLIASAQNGTALLESLRRSLEEGGSESPRLAALREGWRADVPFKGYDATESAPPPADKVGPARANPDHIRYLYLSEDNVTPVYEIRPIIGQTVSVARFQLLRDLTVYDLASDLWNGDNDQGSLMSLIGRMFSRPNNGSTYKYIATQFLAEEIKGLGFDGLRFRSSLHQGGTNLVLFDPASCEAVSSELVAVRSITIQTGKPLPCSE